jgi:hypothetical protein
MDDRRKEHVTLSEPSNEGSIARHRIWLNIALVEIRRHTFVVVADKGVVLVNAGAMNGKEAEETASVATSVVEPI